MAYRVELTRRAESDLREIFGFINAEESTSAARWFFGLQDLIATLATLPERGLVTDYDPKLRYLLYGHKPHVYRILYRVNPSAGCVRVTHIRHGGRKPLGQKRIA
jgi:plasmid stabilization system protein ParE